MVPVKRSMKPFVSFFTALGLLGQSGWLTPKR